MIVWILIFSISVIAEFVFFKLSNKYFTNDWYLFAGSISSTVMLFRQL